MNEELEIHEATIDLKERADATANLCIETCDDVDGKAQIEAVLGLAWMVIGEHPFWRWSKSYDPSEPDDIEDHLGFALRVGIAIGQRLNG